MSGKTEMQREDSKPKISKRQRCRRLLCWLVVDLAVAGIVVVLLLYKPSGYEAIPTATGRLRPGQVHPYWTFLSSELYNGAQLTEPFTLTVMQRDINEAIARWSQESESISLYAPVVLFEPGRIVMMATANFRGVELVVTTVLSPTIDEKGFLNLTVTMVKVGAMPVTHLARTMAKRMCRQRLATVPIDTEDWRAKIAASLLNNEQFEPVFPLEDKKIRVQEITIRQSRLLIQFVPAP